MLSKPPITYLKDAKIIKDRYERYYIKCFSYNIFAGDTTINICRLSNRLYPHNVYYDSDSNTINIICNRHLIIPFDIIIQLSILNKKQWTFIIT